MFRWFRKLVQKVVGKTLYLVQGMPSYTPVTPMEQSCVSHFKLNDNTASTTVIDSRGYSNGTAQQNTSVLHTTGKVGGGLTFNGTSDYVDTNNTFQSVFQSDFSISLWVMPTDGRTSQQIFYGVGTSDWKNSVEMYSLYGLIGWTGAANGKNYNGISTTWLFADGQETWHHIVFVVSGTSGVTESLYFDGVLKKSATHSSVILGNYASSETLYFGDFNEHGTPEGYYFNGDIDNVMLFNRALNSEEVAVLYNAGRGTEDFQLTQQLNTTGESLFTMAA